MRILIRFFLSALVVFYAGPAVAQPAADSLRPVIADSLLQKDSTALRDTLAAPIPADTVSRRPLNDSSWTISPASFRTPGLFAAEVLRRHPYFNFRDRPVPESRPEQWRSVTGKEGLFYGLVLLLLLMAVLRRTFEKYFSDLFRLFFRTTLKQRQIREQLMQTPLPSLLLNVFFVFSAGLYIAFLVEHYRLNPFARFWILYGYCVAGLAAAYLVKFAGLKIAGWLFSLPGPANAYVFIVFIVNKMIGLLLVPLLVVLAFGNPAWQEAALVLSWCGLGFMLLYRIFLSVAALRSEVRVRLFHFLLYVAAFEVAPLLVVYKTLLLYFRIMA